MYEKEITLWPSTASHSSISNFYLALGTAVLYRDYLRFFTGYSKENDTGFFSAFCLSTSAVSLCIAYLCGVFAWGMRPCVKEQTGGEEKLPSEFNLRWGTKYPLLLIPRSDFGRYKKKKLFTFSVIFICLRSYQISSTGNTFEFLQLLSRFHCPGSVPSANCNLVAEFRPIYSILYCNCIQRLTSFFVTK